MIKLFVKWDIVLISPNARIYYFACELLWCALSLYQYLVEVVASPEIGPLFSRLSTQMENIAGWALQERHSPIENEKPQPGEEEALFSAAGKLRDPLTMGWSDELQAAARAAHQRFPLIGETTWLHYYYCAFLPQVLKEFDQLVQRLDSPNQFYQRYRKNITLFDNVREACQKEHPSVDKVDVVSQEALSELLTEMEAFAVRLGAQWRQTVISAAQGA